MNENILDDSYIFIVLNLKKKIKEGKRLTKEEKRLAKKFGLTKN